MRKWIASAALALLAACAPQPADLILYRGKIVTVDDAFSIREAVAIRGETIVAVGGNDLIRRYDAPNVIDLNGRTVLPGFIDTHIHVSGDPKRHVRLAGTTSIAEIQALVAAKARELGQGEWITGYGWSEDELADGRRPLRTDLDRAAPNNPVILWRAGGHSSVSNSVALRLAGITRRSPQPESGVIEKDGGGEPNGIIRERSDLVARLVPDSPRAELRESFVAELRRLLSLGITSIIEAGATFEEWAEWQHVYAQWGDSLPRAAVQIRWAGADSMRRFGKRTGEGDTRLRIGAIKILVDGGFTGPAAYTIEPYKGQPTYYGKLNYTPAQLDTIVKEGHALGWQLGFHTIGDGAITLAVETFHRALAAAPRGDHRHYLNHFTVLPPRDVLETMARDSILISQQPNFTYTLEGRYAANLDDRRLATNNPLATPIGHGIFVALASDNLPIGPMVGLYAAVTRRGMSGAVYGPGERLTVADAIRGYTRNGAYLTWEEHVKGTIEAGKLADLVVLDRDPFSLAPDSLMHVTVDVTVLGGRIVHRRTGN